jgi:integrase
LLVLSSAMSWAVAGELLRSNPLAGVRGPARPQPRRHHSLAEVRPLLGCAEQEVERASASLAAEPASPRWLRSLFSAEQDLLLVRLAANSGARRGKLAVLRLGDLDGRVLTIERGLSHGVRGSTKSPRARRLTLGATTVALIHRQFDSWAERKPTPMSDWLFAPTPARETYMTADALSHKFRRLGRRRRWSTSGPSLLTMSRRRSHGSAPTIGMLSTLNVAARSRSATFSSSWFAPTIESRSLGIVANGPCTFVYRDGHSDSTSTLSWTQSLVEQTGRLRCPKVLCPNSYRHVLPGRTRCAETEPTVPRDGAVV